MGNWRYHTASGHTGIHDILRMDIFNMLPHRIQGIVDLEKSYQVTIGNRNEWARGEPEFMNRV